MIGFWEERFEELASFNSDKDKKKYTDDYLKKMAFMQNEYNDKQVSWARANNYIVVPYQSPIALINGEYYA